MEPFLQTKTYAESRCKMVMNEELNQEAFLGLAKRLPNPAGQCCLFLHLLTPGLSTDFHLSFIEEHRIIHHPLA